MSTDTGRHITNNAHSKRLESPAMTIIKGNKIAIEHKVATVRPSVEKKNKTKNPSAIPERMTSMNQLNLFLAIALAIGKGMV
jgi:hypothetical protein